MSAKFLLKGVVEKVKSTTTSSVTYNVSLKMPMSSSRTTYKIKISGKYYELESLNVYPNSKDVEEGMEVKLFEDTGEHFLGDISCSDEDIIKEYRKSNCAGSWTIIILLLLLAFSIVPFIKLIEPVININNMFVSVTFMFISLVTYGGSIFWASFKLGQLIANMKYN